MDNKENSCVGSAAARRLVARAVLLAAACAAPAFAATPQEWVLSVLEGEAVVVDGVRRVAAAAGMRLHPGAIVETTAKTGLVRLEGSDQSTYDLGPETRAMLEPPGFAARGDRPPHVYLMQGWLKATSRGPREAAGVVTPALEVLPFKGAVVLHQSRREHVAFAEVGRTDLVERRAGSGTVGVHAGEFYGGEGARRGSVAVRPAPAWLKSVPRAFRDPIPLRAAALRDRRVEPQPLPGPTYAQLAEWLTSEAALRTQMPARFAPLARDNGFRAEIVARLAAHPEWEPLVNPDRKRRTTGGNPR